MSTTTLLTAIGTGAGTVFVDDDFDVDGSAKILSFMVNGLLDFGNEGVGAYVGGGFGCSKPGIRREG